MSKFSDLVRSRKSNISAEEVAKLVRETAGYDRVDRLPDGSFKEIDPKEHATTRQIVPVYLPSGANGWKEIMDHLDDTFRGQQPVAYIFGGGASALKLDLSELNGKFVYGINWTRKWFDPTMLQIMDDQPLRSQVIDKKAISERLLSALVTSQTLWDRHRAKGRLDGVQHALFNCRDKVKDHRSFVFPEYPWDPLEHYSNSLGIALQIVYGLGFRKMVLIGFDFGGEHFFGDGKQEGCVNHYGLAGDTKPDLHIKLMALSHVLRQHGVRIAQVGPTKLQWAFDQVGTLEEANKHVRA